MLSGSPEDSNSINRPRSIVPVTTTLHDGKPQISLNLSANSFVLLKLN
jgi:hypothetical protein